MDIQDTSKIIKRSHRESERERERQSLMRSAYSQTTSKHIITTSTILHHQEHQQISTTNKFWLSSLSLPARPASILHRLSVMPASRKCVRRDLLLPVALWPCKNARASSSVYWIVYKLQNVLTLGIWWHYTSGQLLYYNLNILWYVYFVMESCIYTT